MLRTDAHEPEQDLRHAEVAKAPGQAGRDGQNAVGLAGAENIDLGGRRGGRADHGEEAVDVLRVIDDRMQSACGHDRQDEDQHEDRHHHDALHEIGRALGQIPAEESIDQHEHGRDDHHAAVGEAEEVRKQLAAGGQALGRVDAEEDDDDQRADRHDDLFLLMEAVREEIRERESVHGDRIAAQPLGDDQEVEVSTDGKADAGPARVGKTRPIREAGQAHQQIAGHIRGFRAECRDPRAEAAAAEEIGLRVLIRPSGKIDTDPHDCGHIQDHGQQMLQICSAHTVSPFSLPLTHYVLSCIISRNRITCAYDITLK